MDNLLARLAQFNESRKLERAASERSPSRRSRAVEKVGVDAVVVAYVADGRQGDVGVLPLVLDRFLDDDHGAVR